MAASLKVKCATWDQVESFYAKKLKGGRTLTLKVPFSPQRGQTITIALGLPNDMVMAIDGTVGAVAPAGDGRRHTVKLELVGLTEEVVGRLRALVEDGRGGKGFAAPSTPRPRTAPATEPPPPSPMDAPVDELVEPPPQPTAADVAADEREVFLALEAQHRTLRESAAHDVLGVAWDAEVREIRRGYFSLTKRFHPDVYARHRSAAVLHLAQEVFIHINKAYDRMRDGAVAAGKGLVAGPALIPHNGWVAGLEDVVEAEPPRPEERVGPAPEPQTVRSTSFINVPIEPARESIRGRDEGKALFDELEEGDGFDELDEPPSVSFTGSRPQSALTEDALFGDLEPETSAPKAGTTSASGLFADKPLGKADADLVQLMEREALDLMREEAFEQARDRLAAALHVDARNRQLRALYHVANGRVMLESGMRADATTQFETALRHDPDNEIARDALDELRGVGGKKRGLFRKLFDK